LYHFLLSPMLQLLDRTVTRGAIPPPSELCFAHHPEITLAEIPFDGVVLALK